MARYLGDINARARGLRTHLLGSGDLERLARAASLFALQRELSGLGFVRSDAPASAMSLEKAIAYISDDELVEVTPESIRLRKRLLDPHARKREARRADVA